MAVHLLVGTKKAAFFYTLTSTGGDHWYRLPGMLPPVLAVTCAVY